MSKLHSLFFALPPWQWALFAGALVMQLGFVLGGVPFARLGVPLNLPAAAGGVAHFHPKLFVMEIFLALVLLLALARFRCLRWSFRWRPVLVILVVVFGWGLARMAWDLRDNPIAVLRNSAFVWYLSLPLFLWALCLPLAWFDWWIRAFVFVYASLVGGTIFYSAMAGLSTPLFWAADVGLIFLLGFALLSGRRALAWGGALFVGFSIGLVYSSSVSRTTLLGLALTPLLLWSFRRWGLAMPVPQLARLWALPLGFALAIGILLWHARSKGGGEDTLASIREARPLVKSELNSMGMEKFRYFMWRDSVGLFVEHPIFGVGFVRPVVERVYWYAGTFLPNDGNREAKVRQEPPVAGPHNSYLNAIARLGLLGALFVALHGMVALVFLRRGCWMALFLFLGQALYAVFNVGLEGPVRSFLILLLCGYALTLEQAEKEDPPEDIALG